MKTSISRTLVGLLAAAGLVGASVNAQAATATSTFTVAVNLTSACKITAAPANITVAYTSLQTTAATQDSAFGITCSTGLPFQLSLGDGLTAGAYEGTVLGLDYDLSILNAGGTTIASQSTLLSGNQTAGSGSNAFSVRATIPAAQAGNCATPTAVCNGTSATIHTLTLTY